MARNSFNVSEEKNTFLSPRLFFEISKITKDRQKKYYHATPKAVLSFTEDCSEFLKENTQIARLKLSRQRKRKIEGK